MEKSESWAWIIMGTFITGGLIWVVIAFWNLVEWLQNKRKLTTSKGD